jgi:hypothetical protein
MGPKIGEYLSDRILGIADPAEEKMAFALSTHKAWETQRGFGPM